MEKNLSIIVPSYNMEAYLPKCLGSFIVDDKDLLQKLEVIVVNDGSKDRTSEIAHEFEKKYPGVFRVIDKPNGNYGSCINRGLKEAQGSYVKTIDADDWVDNGNFAEYLAFIDAQIKNGNFVDLILNDFDFVHSDEVPYRTLSYSFVTEADFTIAGFTYNDGRELWMHAIAYKTDNLRKINYNQMEGVSYTDEEWLSQPMTTVKSLAYFPKVVYKYLMGRVGQTCDPDEYVRSYWMLLKILKKLLVQYSKQIDTLPELNNAYMVNHLLHRLRSTYTNLLLNKKIKGLNAELLDFDSFLKTTVPSLYAQSDNICVTKRFFKFYFVREWRKKQRKTFRFTLYSLYLFISSSVGKYICRTSLYRMCFGVRTTGSTSCPKNEL